MAMHGPLFAMTKPRQSLADRLLAAIEDAGPRGLTDDEAEQVLNVAGNSLRPTRRRLQECGWIRPAGRWRPTRTGHKARVWVLTR